MEIFEETNGIPEGLTSEEAARLAREGKSNISNEKVGKSYRKIVFDNLFTYFNLIWAVIAAVLIAIGSYSNLTFLVVVLLNTGTSIIQEIKAKRTVGKLAVTTDPTARVVRDGDLITVRASDIVLGDVMLVEMGRQVLSDAIVVGGVAEANESMLTGEADAIKKQEGDRILAGSFLVSGSVYAKVINVGKDNYVNKLEKAAKSFKAPASNLFRDLNKLIKSIGILIIPLAAVLGVINYIGHDGDVIAAIEATAGSIVAMVPAGIYLLVTMTLTLSVVTLSQKQTLVQDMYSIEMLASADVVCLDKTGTITDGTMQVVDYTILDGTGDEEFRAIMAIVEGAEQSVNNTSRALVDYFGKNIDVKINKLVPFSSARKYSAVDAHGVGVYAIGAPRFVPCPVTEDMDAVISRHAANGERVILLSRLPDLDSVGTPIALIAISDRIRPAAKDTIAAFQAQGVTIKVISGDHAETVSTIARQVGIKDADKYVSCEKIDDTELIEKAEDYAVFGRVTPEQKVLLIKTLKAAGHTVAMTGDGVNDTLALKESNCAIAMADGSEVARKISQIVLMNSDFATLPDVVKEGRRCINNVRKSAVLYLMKTIFALLLSAIAIVTLSPYPFSPNNLFLLELFIIGLGSVLLALEPNNTRITGSFMETVIIKSLPNALAMIAPVLALMIVEKTTSVSLNFRNATSMACVTLVGFLNLLFLCRPFTKWRAAVCALCAVALGAVIPFSILGLADMFRFGYVVENLPLFFIMMGSSIAVTVVLQIFRGSIESIIEKHFRKKPLFSEDN